MQKKIYSCTSAQVESFRTVLAGQGIAVPPGDEGQIRIDKYDVTLGFSYDGKANLALTLLHDAWYETADMVWDKIDGYLA